MARNLAQRLDRLERLAAELLNTNQGPVYVREGTAIPDNVAPERVVTISRVFLDPPEQPAEHLPEVVEASPAIVGRVRVFHKVSDPANHSPEGFFVDRLASRAAQERSPGQTAYVGLRFLSTRRWRLRLSATSTWGRCFLRQDCHAGHVQGSYETDRASYCGKDCTPTKWSSPADEGGSLKSEGPTDIRKKCTGQPSH
jgi:hypothetical protein